MILSGRLCHTLQIMQCKLSYNTVMHEFGIMHDKSWGIELVHLPRDLANVNEWQIMFDRYCCINSKKTHRKLRNICATHSSALPPFSYERTLFINILDSGRGQVLFLMMIWRLSALSDASVYPRSCHTLGGLLSSLILRIALASNNY